MKSIFICILIAFTAFSCKKDENKMDPILAFAVNARTVGTAPFEIKPPVSSSSGAFSYTSSDPAVATVNGSTVTVVGEGITTITAKQSANDNYNEAVVSATFQVVREGTYVLGQHIPGGIIYYINGTGQHGYMISEEDISLSAPWTNGSLAATSATASALGGGVANTDKIIAAFGEGMYAAKLCRDYRGGSFQDWYLPSASELSTIRLRKDIIGGLNDTNYWTSTEVSATASNAQFIYFGNSSMIFNGTTFTVTVNNFSKLYTYCVRAVRAF